MFWDCQGLKYVWICVCLKVSVQKTWADSVWIGDGSSGPCPKETTERRAGNRGNTLSHTLAYNLVFLLARYVQIKNQKWACVQKHRCDPNCREHNLMRAFVFPCVSVCVWVQTVRIFSLKGMTSKLFGQESPEQKESRLAALEQSIQEGEETVKEKNTECQ